MARARFVNYETRSRVYLQGKLAPNAERAATVLRDEIVDVMERSTPSGKIYPGGHQASAPGEPPAIDKGDYARSWKVGKPKLRRTLITAIAYTDLKVGKYLLGDLLERGTERMKPRPHVRVALATKREELRRILGAE